MISDNAHISKIIRYCALVFALIGFCLSGYGQTTGDYRTVSNGNWSNDNIWERWDGDSWETPNRYPGEEVGTGNVDIRHNVTLNRNPLAIGSLTIQGNLAPNNNDRSISITGDLIISSGTLSFSEDSNRELTISVGSNFSMSGGTLTENGNYGELIFNGSGIQAFNKTGGTISEDIRFTVNSGSVLDMGTSVLDGSNGSFTLSSGAGLITAHPDGISSSGSSGSIQVTGSRNFSTGADYTYDGTASQVTGTGLPATVNNLTVDNNAGIVLTSSVTISGTLTLGNGILYAEANNVLVTNNAMSSVTGSSSSFVNLTTGYLQRALPGNLSGAGNNYSFPIGEGGVYKAINLSDVITGATGPELRAYVSPTGAVTPDGITVSLIRPRYWSVTNANSGDFTGAAIELYESGLTTASVICTAPAAPGTYSAIGGVPGTTSIVTPFITGPGPYFAIGELDYTAFYSYKTGAWDDPATWTSDPSGTLQIGNEIPHDGSTVVILTDRTVTLGSDVTESGLNITINNGAFLDQSTRQFTDILTSLSGQGTLRLASVSFPGVTSNTFVNSGGGSVEYYNSSDFTMPATQGTYNNLIINTSGATATQLSDLVLNGSLIIRSGNFRINNNVNTTRLSLTINGSFTVDNGASVSVGNGVTNTAIGGTGGTAPYLNYYLNFHTVIVRGDFTNNGTVRFTNLTYPVYNAFPPTVSGPTSGAASVYFEGAADNTLTCNGVTDFYNLILNKGTDQTYRLTVNSSGFSNFRLFGANTLAAESVSGNPVMRKALWIYSGTLILKGSVIIPSLSEGSSGNAFYYIPANGALIIDGVDVALFVTADDYREVNTAWGVTATGNGAMGINTTGAASALYVFGKLQVINGVLSAKESGGIVTSSTASGQVIINGGVVDAKQFLSSTGSASYSQSGGTFILRGRFQRTPVSYVSIPNLTDMSVATLNTTRATSGINASFGSFNLENTANIYTVSGGTIRIHDVTTTGTAEAFDVKASLANINVTGGTLEMLPATGSGTNATSYSIHSTAPLWNLIVNRSGSTADVRFSTAITVSGNLTLASGVLNANSNNLSIGGNFILESGTSYTTGTNITSMNGSLAQTLTVNLASPLSLSSFTVSKPSGVTLTFAGTQGTVNVSSALSIVAGTLNDGGKTINVSGNIFNSGIAAGSGRISVAGSSAQTINGAGTFTNLELANTAATPVSLLANMTLNGTLTFSVNNLLNIGVYNLHLNSPASIVNSGSARFIQTSGNAGDRGLSRTYSSTGTFTFPVGVAGKYTPATIGFTSAPATYGTVTVIPVDYEHPLTAVKGQSLSYFWRVKSSGFSGIPLFSLTHSFVYDNADIGGVEADYIPALYDGTLFNWYPGQSSGISIATNTISDWTAPSNSTNFLDADYTAGSASSFGTPSIFYSRQSGLWSSTSTWSLTGHTVNDPPASAPGANDIVIIGGNDSIWLATETPPLPSGTGNPASTYYQRNKAIVNCANLQIEAGSVLDIQNNPGSTFASVLTHPGGNGKLRITTRDASNFDWPEPFVYPSGDFSEFSLNDGISEFYTINPESGAYYILPSNASEYGTVVLTPLRGSNIILPNLSTVTINGDLICNGSDADAWLAMTWNGEYGTILAKTVNVSGDLVVAGGSFGFIYNGTRLQRINIEGDVHVAPGAGIDVWSSSTNNIMSVGGSIFNNSDNSTAVYGTPSLFRMISGGNRCDLIFTGNRSAFVTNDPLLSTTPVTVFNNVTINKGTSPDSTLTWNIGGSLTTPNNGWLTLQNGTLVYERTGNLNISTTTDFIIPSTAGLTINTPSSVYISNNAGSETLYLNGRLRILSGGGNVYIGPDGNTGNNADIEYSGSGSSLLEIGSGNLFVNGQIRRPVASTNGTLTYRQSGGNVIIYGNNASAEKAKLEVLNEGSEFTMSGGNLAIVRGGGTTFGDLYLRPATGSVTGGTVTFSQTPAGGTVIDEAQSFVLDANIPLNNITVTGKTTGTNRNAELSLMVSPLVVNGSLTLSNNRSLVSSNNRNITIKGNMVNHGTYNHGTNMTIFDGGVQTVTGSSVTNFYDLEVSSVTSLTTSGSFTVNRNLNIVSGNLVLGSGLLSLMGNLSNNGAYTDDNITGGIRLSGSVLQTISGTGSFARMIIDNPAGVRLDNDIALQHDLVLTRGILDVNKYLLTLSQNSLISGSALGTSKMIKSDGVSSSQGVLKFFPAGAQTFTFPVGVSGKYTPALFTVTANSTVGSIRVNPVNEVHPTVTDPLNSLKYYWQTESSGISGFSGSLLLSYLTDDVSGDEASYVAARLLLPGSTWDKAAPGPSTDNVDETANTITFNYTVSDNLNGEYTAGTDTAIPDEVAEYVTNSDGFWSDPAIWTPVGASPPCPAGGPAGSNVIIDHVVTADINFISVLNTTINNELRIVAPTYGHNLGHIEGDGKLYVESGNLPGGTYNDFIDCTGDGTIEYGGSGTYTIVSGVYTSVPNLVFSGTGTRILPNADLTVCRSLVIDGPVLDNSVNNRKLTIGGTFERYNGGAFRSGTGSYPAATVSFRGSAAQGITGDFSGSNRFWNMEIDNPAGLTVNNGSIAEIGNQLHLTNGVISTSSSGRLVLLSTSSSAVIPVGGSSLSWVSGPLSKQIVNGDAFIFPLGRGSIRGHRFTLTSDAGSTTFFTAEYFAPNGTATSIAPPLQVANTLEYWSVSSVSPASARIKLGWDPQSDLTPLVTENGLADMRVARYVTGLWTEQPSTATGDNNNGEVETSGSVAISATPADFTTASITGTLARASFSSFAPICGSGGIPVSFISFTPISLTYILSYTIDGIAQPDVIVSSLPYTLPANVTGVYRLTGFRFNGGSGTGVVDANTVTVYEVPTTANAGTNQSLCGLSTTTLDGNDPGAFSGLWTVVSGAGGSFDNSTQYNTQFSGVLGVSYTLRWTISNGPCTSSDEVIISFPVVASRPDEFTASETLVCPGGTGYVYTVPFVSGVTYNWSYSGTGHTISGSGNSVTVGFSTDATSGTLSVTATNACGTSPARSVGITVRSASFSYPGSPYCQNGTDPVPVLGPGSVSGTFSSTAGLVFISTSTGQIDLSASKSGVYTVTNTVDPAVCTGLSATATVTIAGETWTGSVNSSWDNPANWSCGFVPFALTSVEIPDVAIDPVISSGFTGEAGDISLIPGASLILSGGTLRIYGSLSGSGGVDASSGTVEFTGSVAQTTGGSHFTGGMVMNLTVNNSAGVSLSGPLSVSGVVLVQNGGLASGGQLTLVSDATGTALIDGSGTGPVTGSVTMQRYLPSKFGYRYISSPFIASVVNEFADDMDLASSFPLFYRYDESRTSSGWVSYATGTDPLNPMEGYAVNFGSLDVPGTIDVSGEVSNGAVAVTLYNHDNTYTEGFNLVGNPYPSPVDWNAAGWVKTNIDNALYFFRASSTDEYGGTYSTYVNGISSDGVANNIIPSMQGFFVHVSDGTYPVTGTLGATNSVRINDKSHVFFKSASSSERFLIRLAAAFADDTLSADPTVVYFDAAAAPEFDPELDALKLFNTDMMVTNLYSVLPGNERLSVNALPPQNDTVINVPLGITTYRDGEIVFRLRNLENLPENVRVILHDAVTGKSTDLGNSGTYRTSLDAGVYNNRFALAIRKNLTDAEIVPDDNVIFSAYSSGYIVRATVGAIDGADGSITVFDLGGRPVHVRKVFETGIYNLDINLKQGIYLVNYSSGSLKSTVKLAIGL
ncbi:MAG: hypothetical protein MUE37_00155 [Bacteroidales bacterium]|nr:hypothetical protein [Bacteroidales bacterium]